MNGLGFTNAFLFPDITFNQKRHFINFVSKDKISISVFGKENDTENDEFHRHIAEAGFKPAIFGSHAYDPIKNCFDVTKKSEAEEGGRESTLMNTDESSSTHSPMETEAPSSSTAAPETPAGDQETTTTPGDKSLRGASKSTFWWARAKDSYQNLTHYLKNAIV